VFSWAFMELMVWYWVSFCYVPDIWIGGWFGGGLFGLSELRADFLTDLPFAEG
jgi:hypothetical protein